MGQIQEHPDYSEGYYCAEEGKPLHTNASREFAEGWQAYWRAVRILARIAA